MNSQLKQTPGGIQSIFKLVTIKKVPNQNAKTSKNNNNNDNNIDKSDSTTNILTPKINTTCNSKTENPITSGFKTQIDATSTTTTTTNTITTAPVVIKRPKVFQSPTKKPSSPPSFSSSSTSSPEKEEPSTLAYHNNSQNMTVREQGASKNLNLYQNPTVSLRVPKIIKPILIKVGEKARTNYEEEKENNNSVLSTMPSQQKQESSVKDERDSLYVDRSFDLKIPNYYDQNQQDQLKSSYKEETNDYKKKIVSALDKTVTRCRAKAVLSQLDDQKKQVTDYEAECQRKIRRMKEITKQMEHLGEELKVLLQDS